MKRLPLILCFIIVSFGLNAQMTNIPISVTYRPTLDKLDTIEDKLLAHIRNMCNGKTERDLSLFMVNYLYNDRWAVPLTISESCDSFPHKDILRSNDYRLDIKWGPNLDTGYVIGFSREYYIKRQGDFQNQLDIAGGMVFAKDLPLLSKVYLSPMNEVPLCEYNKFLTRSEIDYLYGTIKNYFINTLTDNKCYDCGAAYAENTSFRYVQLHQTDSLAQMPWSQWTWRMLGYLKFSYLGKYKNSSCTNILLHQEVQDDFVGVQQLYDSNGNSTNVGMGIGFNSIIVAEKWSFDTLPVKQYSIEGPIVISRKITAIGFVPDVPSSYDQRGHFTVWMKYTDLEKLIKEDREPQYDLYNLLLSSVLFRKLGLFYLY